MDKAGPAGVDNNHMLTALWEHHNGGVVANHFIFYNQVSKFSFVWNLQCTCVDESIRVDGTPHNLHCLTCREMRLDFPFCPERVKFVCDTDDT